MRGEIRSFTNTRVDGEVEPMTAVGPVPPIID
jgi:hypothetical protein